MKGGGVAGHTDARPFRRLGRLLSNDLTASSQPCCIFTTVFNMRLQCGVWKAAARASLGCVLVSCLFGNSSLRAQETDDQGWSQFTRDNTIRGTVVASAPNAFTVKTDSGEQWRLVYGPNTRIMKQGQGAKPADIHNGDMVFAAGNLDAKKRQVGAAILIGVDAAEVEKAKEGLGKTWSAGKVTAVSGARISIQRLDGVAQTIVVDENTSFRLRGDSVTLADVKVGGGVRAEGHIENGAFTATVLHLFNPSGHEPWLDAGAQGR